MQHIQGWVEKGNTKVTVSGLQSTTLVQQSFPLATVTVYLTGTITIASIFSDSTGTPLANPFTANADGTWGFYAEPGLYDVVFSGTGIAVPFTLVAIGNAISTFLGAAYLSACGFVGGDPGAKINAAIAALPSTGGTVDARCMFGAQTISTTIVINKPVVLLLGAATFAGPASPMISVTTTVSATIIGSGIDITKLTPTAGTAIAVSPASGIPVEIASLTIDMTNATSQKAMTLNNVSGGLIHNLKINGGTYGIDISNTGLTFFEDLFVYNNSTAGIRLLGDGGQEDYFRNVWIINNNAAVNQTDGFLLSRTTNADTGGLYMDRVFIVQNSAGGTMTNGLHFVSTAGTATILFAELSNIVVDGIKGGASVLFDKVARIDMQGGSITNAALVASAFPAIHLKNTNQVDLLSVLMASNWADLKLEGAVDSVGLIDDKFYGAGPVSVGHINIVGGATLSNFRIYGQTFDLTTTWTNNQTALDLSMSTSNFLTLGSYIRIPNNTAYQALNSSGVPLALLEVDASNNTLHGVQGTKDHIFYVDQFTSVGMRLSGTTSSLAITNGLSTGGQAVIGSSILTSDFIRIPNQVAYQSKTAGGVPMALFQVDASNNVTYGTAGSQDHIWYLDQFSVEGMRLKGVGGALVLKNYIQFTAIPAPACGAGNYFIYADSGVNLLKKCNNGALSNL